MASNSGKMLLAEETQFALLLLNLNVIMGTSNIYLSLIMIT